MHIVVDEAVSLAQELLGPLGRLTILPAGEISGERLRDADALVVRSGVRVGRGLLEGTRVRFVGTATAGVDHVDEAWLKGAGIVFASAPGCNARAVGEYVVAALLEMAAKLGRGCAGLTLGVVGVGHVGRIVAALADVLGMRVLLCDPPRARNEGDRGFVELERLLCESDVVSLHVPLTRSGVDATLRMMDERRLGLMRPGAVLINAARGEVLNTAAAMDLRRSGRLGGLVCDVWESEPLVDRALLEVADIVTPHIAGYTLEGKIAGSWVVTGALVGFFRMRFPNVVGGDAGSAGRLVVRESGLVGEESALRTCVAAAYDICADADRFREAIRGGADRPELLGKIRRDYPLRREFASYQVELSAFAPAMACRLQDQLARLGFGVN